MTVEERLAEWLEQATPEPPHPIEFDRVGAPSRRRAATRTWRPILAAACVVLALVGILLAVGRHHSHHDNVPANPTSRPTESAPTRTTPPPVHVTLPAQLWHAKVLRPVPFVQANLVGAAGVVYGSTGRALAAVDESGRLLATTGDLAQPTDPVVSAGLVWTASRSSAGSVAVVGFAQHSLIQRASIAVTEVGDTGNGISLLTAPHGRLLLAAGNTVAWIDPVAADVTRRIAVSGDGLRGAAESEATGRVYAVVATVPTGSATQLRTLDSHTGAVLASSNLGSATLLAISRGGVWLSSGEGHQVEILFAGLHDLNDQIVMDYSIGGYSATASTIGNTVWLGGSGSVVCADPASGVPRRSAAVNRSTVAAVRSVMAITRTDGRTFALYSDANLDANRLVELHPPAACRS